MKGLFNRHQVDPQRLLRDFSELLELAQPDLEAETYAQAHEVVQLAQQRLGFDPQTAVVALVGATGSGKSSLFNALLGADIAPTGVRRPTTTEPIAAVQGGAGVSELLDWLQVRQRVQIPADGLLPENVALLDLPDVDSVVTRGREVVSFLAKRVDLLIWVTDPQKYADNLLHTEFIRPLAKHATMTVAVLTKSDLLSPADQQVVVADLQRILEAAEVNDPRVVPVSAVTGSGVAQLRELVEQAAARQLAQSQKLLGALAAAKESLAAQIFAGVAEDQLVANFKRVGAAELAEPLREAVYQVGQVTRIERAVAESYRFRAGLACGFWPLRKLRLFRADPAKQLHLGQAVAATNLVASQQALGALELAVQHEVGKLRDLLPSKWFAQLEALAVAGTEVLPAEVDGALAQLEVQLPERPLPWWRAANFVQLLGWALALAGGVWLLAVHLLRSFLLIDLPVYTWNYVPAPVWLLIFGISFALLVSLVTQVFVGVVSKKAAQQTTRMLRQRLDAVVVDSFVSPLESELGRQQSILQKFFL